MSNYLLPNGSPIYFPGNTEDVLVLEGYFFLKKSAISKNEEMSKKTVGELYKYLSNN